MPRICTICRHPEREAINQALVAGEPLRNIAARFGTSSSSVYRHQQEHLPVAMLKAAEAREVAHGGDLLAQLQSLQERTLTILGQAEAAGELRTALLGVREARGCVELYSKLTGQLVERHAHEVQPMPPDVAIELRKTLGALRERLDSGPRTIDIKSSPYILEGEAAVPRPVDMEHEEEELRSRT